MEATTSGQRLSMIRRWAKFENQNDFADHLGIGYTTYNNYENGFPIPHKSALMIVKKLPWVTTDYIYLGAVSNAEIGRMEAELRVDPERAG